MELKPGYKQTEVGVIPEDWDAVLMSSIGCSIIGLTYSPSNVREYGTLVLRSSNIQRGYLAFEDNVYVEMDLPNRVIVKEGDLLICVRNGSRQLIGKCALIDKNTAGSAFGAFMSVYRSSYSNYVFYQFQSNIIQKQIAEVLGATINQITNKDLSRFYIALPPTRTEQTAIANALSDADALIQSLTRLIAKKRQIKQGAMQTLLNPYENGRLKEGWAVRELGELIAHCSSGATPYRGIPSFYKGNIKWITSGELNYNVIEDTIEKISLHAVEKTNLKIHPIGTFLIAITGLEAEGTRGACGIVGIPASTNQSCMAIYPNKGLITEYLYHYYVYKGKELALKYCQGTKQQSYTAKLVRILPIALPQATEEQIRIAKILSGMDTEIAALETKLAKYRHIKQGMMQNLLTGRIRLVKPESNTGAVA